MRSGVWVLGTLAGTGVFKCKMKQLQDVVDWDQWRNLLRPHPPFRSYLEVAPPSQLDSRTTWGGYSGQRIPASTCCKIINTTKDLQKSIIYYSPGFSWGMALIIFSQVAKVIFRHITSMTHLLPIRVTPSQSIEIHIFTILAAPSKRAPLSMDPSPSFGPPLLTQELSMWHRYHVASFRARASSLSFLLSTVLRL